MEKIYLNVPYEDKDEAKVLGARWDMDARKWYCTDAIVDRFSKWYTKRISYNDLSDEQKHCIDIAKQGNNILVDACIGSGKTTTIQVMCNEISDKKILYLTFNKLLKDDAQKKIVSPNATVTNYDGFAYQALKAGKCPVDYERNIRLFNTYKPETADYDLLILDEYQDIKEDISVMLTIIKERNPNIQIIAVGDMEQKIYNFTALNIRKFINDFLGEYDKLNFTTCFRLSKDHAKHLGDLWGKKINGGNDKQETIICHDLMEIVNFLADKDPKDILVLGGRNGDATKVLNELEYRCPDRFNKNTVYASIKDEDGGYANKSDSAIFTTFDSSKGLERKYCVVIDLTVEYWHSRASKPNSDYEILRNLFLVASSRGKQVNVFYDNPNGSRHIASNFDYSESTEFSRGEIISKSFAHKYSHKDPFNASEMYNFLYAEDIEKCMELIKITKVESKMSDIDVVNHTGNIDLSLCIGHYVEAGFFENYDIDKEADLILLNQDKFIKPFCRAVTYDDKGKRKEDRVRFFDEGVTVDEKILMLTATATDLDRYCWQVDVPFVADEEKEQIRNRLLEQFNGKEEVQTSVEIDFIGSDGNGYQMCGRTDVITDDTVVELKFTEDLRETHYLQLAFYLCCMEGYKGKLWNIKTNEMVMVEVPDVTAFLQQTVRAITKRSLSARTFIKSEKNKTLIDKAENKRKRKQKKSKKASKTEDKVEVAV